MLFQVLDRRELEPDFRENVLLEDVETGEAVEVAPDFMNQVYPQRIREHIRTIATTAAASGADHVLVDTSAGLDAALRNYLLFRQKRQ